MMTKGKQILLILKGVVIGYAITIVLTLIYAALLAYTDINESTIPTFMFVISIISVFIASSIIVIKTKEKGLKNGGLIGFTYILLIYILGSITGKGFEMTGYVIVTMIFNILLGMIGGVIGVNIAK